LGCDRDDVDRRILEHLADVFFPLGLESALPLADLNRPLRAEDAIDIDDVRDHRVGLAGEGPDVAAPAPLHSDHRHIQPLVGALAGNLVLASQQVPGRPSRGSRSGGEHRVFEELTAVAAARHDKGSCKVG
jgi:hypothetical protein